MKQAALVLTVCTCTFAQSSLWQKEMDAGTAALANRQTLGDAEGHYRAAVEAASAPAERASALTHLGLVLQSTHDSQREYLTGIAQPLYLEALGLIGPAPSPDRALALELCSRLLDNVGRGADAERYRAEAIEIRKGLFPGVKNLTATRIGEGVIRPQLLEKTEPQYTNEARTLRHQGAVVLSAVVDRDGTIREVALVRSLGLGLDEQALAAIRQWKFQPGTVGGSPVDVRVQIEVNFRLL